MTIEITNQVRIQQHEGYWCQLCQLDLLGPRLPLVTDDND